MYIVIIILVFLSIPAILITGMNIYEAKNIASSWVVHYKNGTRRGPMFKKDALDYLGRPDVSYIEKIYGYDKRTLYKYDNTNSWWD